MAWSKRGYLGAWDHGLRIYELDKKRREVNSRPM